MITKIILEDNLVKNNITSENNENVTIPNTNVSHAVRKVVYSDILIRCRDFLTLHYLTHKSDKYEDLLKIIKFINDNQKNETEDNTNQIIEKNKFNLVDSIKFLCSYDHNSTNILNIINLTGNLMKILNLVLDTIASESRKTNKYLDEFCIMINYLSKNTSVFDGSKDR